MGKSKMREGDIDVWVFGYSEMFKVGDLQLLDDTYYRIVDISRTGLVLRKARWWHMVSRKILEKREKVLLEKANNVKNKKQKSWATMVSWLRFKESLVTVFILLCVILILYGVYFTSNLM